MLEELKSAVCQASLDLVKEGVIRGCDVASFFDGQNTLETTITRRILAA